MAVIEGEQVQTSPLPAVDDRRRDARQVTASAHGVQRARVRPGIDVRLLDICAEGALIETAHRLLPGRRLELQLTFATGVVSMAGTVLRCSVSHASIDRIAYRGAIGFERRLLLASAASGAVGASVS